VKLGRKKGAKLVFTTAVILVMLALIITPASASRIQLEKYVTNPNGFEQGDVIDFTIFVGNPSTNPYTNTQTVTDIMPDGTVDVLQVGLVLAPGQSIEYHVQHTVTAADVTAGEVINTVRLDGTDSNNDIIEAATQARADITEIFEPPVSDEFWAVEWFQTDPHQYTQFDLPDDQLYLTTLSWFAPESYIHLWDGPTGGDYAYEGERVKFIHDPDRTDDIYFNEPEVDIPGSVKVHGTFGEGPGDHDFIDPETGLKPENAPYTIATGPFYPQSEQSPIKDFVTFSPAIMFHNDDGMPWNRILSYGTNAEGEKVFKRMSYEKDLFKDENGNGCFDVVLRNGNNLDSDMVICLDERETIMGLLADMSEDWHILTENNRLTVNGVKADIYAPAIIQEFTYMFLDDMMPMPVDSGSTVLIPMANNPAVGSGSGLNSFEPAPDGVLEGVEVESENTLNMDIDGDGFMRAMDPDGKALNGDESVVLVLRQQYLETGDSIQFFDHVITLDNVGEFDAQSKAVFTVSDNEGNGYTMSTSGVTLAPGQVQTFYRADDNPAATEAPAFYLKVETASYQDGNKYAYVEVGRLFGHPGANIAQNKYHSQKAFWVQDVYYNVVALKTYPANPADDIKERIKYITFREKLPKADVKVHNHHFEVWDVNDRLPEMAPFSMPHRVVDDVNDEWTHNKIGNILQADPLDIRYIDESDEDRFFGELKEIYEESGNLEFWIIEWFKTMPYQYTEFQIIERFTNEKRLFTSAFIAPESCIHMWNGGEDDGPMFTKEGERAKFWFDDNYDPLYVDDGELKIFGTFGEGPGDHTFVDQVTGLKPENAPYTDAMGPFDPQSVQAPIKDSVTFNPAIMYHNDDGEPWDRILSYGTNAEAEKVFKRMSYEKDLFKDENGNGCFDVVLERAGDEVVVCLENEDQIHDYLSNGWVILTENNRLTVDGVKADIYAPAIIQEFTYMFLDDMMPMAVDSGSTVLIPMANDPDVGSGSGLNSFVPGPDAVVKGVQVESENTLELDIDGDGIERPMDPDGQPLSGDESVVLVLKHQLLTPEVGSNSIQFFDHVITLDNVGEFDSQSKAIFTVEDNEGAGYDMVSSGIMLGAGDVQTFYRADDDPADTEAPAFYIKLETASYQAGDKFAYVEIGRLFGHPGANIAKNQYHSQKAFWVQDVYYNVVALKTYPADNTKEKIKFITFREKLPKADVKVHNHHFEVWGVNDRLPEMAPFCMDHNIMDDVQYGWEWPIQKIGDERGVGPLVITYTEEEDEPRFHGELKEIYWEKDNGNGGAIPCPWDLTEDGLVNIDDVKELVANWGSSGASDFNEDGTTNIEDVKILVANWGTCPTT